MKFASKDGKWFKHSEKGWVNEKNQQVELNSRAKFYATLPSDAPAWLKPVAATEKK